MPELSLRRLLALAAVGLGMILQGWVAGAVWGAGGGARELIWMALGVVFFAVGLGVLEDRGGRLYGWLYLTLAVSAPPYGSLGSVALFVYRRLSRGTGLARDYAAYIDAETADRASAETGLEGSSVDQMVQHELNVQSYMDIMRGNDRLLKKALIGRILSSWTPNAVALLRISLRDEDYEIRSYASTALTAIESRMSDNLLRRREAVAAGGEAVDGLRLAEAYLDYADSGLLDDEMTRHYVALAREALEGIAFATDDGFYLRWAGLRAQAARAGGDEDVERSLCDEVLRVYPDHADTLRQLCELDFRQGRLEELRHNAQRLLDRIGDEHPAAAAARLWVSEGEAAA